MKSKSEPSKGDRELLYPHSPDVLEREVSDGGFSKGWGMHFAPTEKYWLDVHVHIDENTADGAVEAMNICLKSLSGLKIGRIAAILPEMLKEQDKGKYGNEICIYNIEEMKSYLTALNKNERVSTILFFELYKSG